MSVQNLKQIAVFVQKLLGGPKFRPAAESLPEGAGPPKINQLETVTTYTYSQFGEDRCTQFPVIVVTDTAHPPARPPVANTPTDRTDNNTLTAR